MYSIEIELSVYLSVSVLFSTFILLKLISNYMYITLSSFIKNNQIATDLCKCIYLTLQTIWEFIIFYIIAITFIKLMENNEINKQREVFTQAIRKENREEKFSKKRNLNNSVPTEYSTENMVD